MYYKFDMIQYDFKIILILVFLIKDRNTSNFTTIVNWPRRC